MKKTYRLEDLDCANCAAKLERALSKVEGVASVRVNFLRESLTLEAEDTVFDEVLQRVVRAAGRAEANCRIVM